MVEEGLANGTILPPTHCNPRCSQQEFEVTNLKEKSKKKSLLGKCWIKGPIIYYQTYVSVAKWPYKEYTPKLAEESGLIYDGSPVTYSNWNLNYLSSLNDTVLQNTLNLNREHSGKGFAKVLCYINSFKLWAHWHLSKEFMRRRVFKRKS